MSEAPNVAGAVADAQERITKNVKLIMWGGAHLDADTHDLFRTEVMPYVEKL